jgi:O-antigen ligase
MYIAGMSVIMWLIHVRKLIPILLVFLCLGIFFLPKDLRSAGVELWRTASINARVTSAKNALTIFYESPLFGSGFNTYRYAQQKKHFISEQETQIGHSDGGTDNSLLFVLSTTGIVGLYTYIYFLFKSVKVVLKSYRNEKVDSFNYAMCVISVASVVGLLVSSLFINSLFYPVVMLWLWIVL